MKRLPCEAEALEHNYKAAINLVFDTAHAMRYGDLCADEKSCLPAGEVE